MTKESGNHQYVSYPMFKGFKNPLNLWDSKAGISPGLQQL